MEPRKLIIIEWYIYIHKCARFLLSALAMIAAKTTGGRFGQGDDDDVQWIECRMAAGVIMAHYPWPVVPYLFTRAVVVKICFYFFLFVDQIDIWWAYPHNSIYPWLILSGSRHKRERKSGSSPFFLSLNILNSWRANPHAECATAVRIFAQLEEMSTRAK